MPDWRHQIRARLEGLRLDPAREAEIVDELEQHLSDRFTELVNEGAPNDTAFDQALEELESNDLLRMRMTQLRQAAVPTPIVPGEPGRHLLADVVQDVGYGLRMLRRQPAFSAIAVLVLALGIGVNIATFSIFNILLLKPRTGGVDARLVGVFSRSVTEVDSYREFSYDEFARLRERSDLFPSLTGHAFGLLGLEEGDGTRRVFADIVTAGYFETFGVAPVLGRGFTREEERPGADIPVTVISYGLWQRLGGANEIVGGLISLNTRDYTVIGVAPRGFGGSMAMVTPEVWVPTGVYDSVVFDARNEGEAVRLSSPDMHALIVVARLAPDGEMAPVVSALPGASRQVFDASPGDHRAFDLHLAPLSRMSVSTRPQDDDELTGFVGVLISLAGVVLLIASFNLANMLLARGRSREREFAIRAAIGGSRFRLIRQLFAEHLVLALIGAICGLAFSTAGLWFLVRQMPSALPFTLAIDPVPDARVIASTVGFAVVAAVLFGLAPAWRFARADAATSLKATPSDVGGRARWRGLTTRNALMTAQVALTFVMLTASGLFVGGALQAAHTDPGFTLDAGIIANLDTTFIDLAPAESRAFYEEAVTRLRAEPGIASASLASWMPFGEFESSVRVVTPEEPDQSVAATHVSIGADYFETMTLAMRAGREFTGAEAYSADGEPVVIVDETLAAALFDEGPAVGRHLRLTSDPTAIFRVVGVAEGVRGDLFDTASRPVIYFPFGSQPRASMYLHARTTAATPEAELAMLPSVRAALHDILSRPAPIVSLDTRPGFRERNLLLAIVRTGASVFLVLGVAALFLAAVGVYGVKSYLVARRTREIGVRIALGAQPRDVIGMVLGDGAVLVGIGVLIGAGLSVLTGMAMRPVLFQGRAIDLPVIAIATATLVASVLLASWLPARRATRVPPTTALRAG